MKEYKVFIFDSIELNREVRATVFLPENYEKSEKNYPVLYMHDGQNLFDDKLATYGKSWGIIEAYKNDPNLPELIIVGIDSSDSRSEELVPFEFNKDSGGAAYGGKSDIYYDFITKTLKTIIDKRYRTIVSADNTGIMGSSYGGLSSTYAALKYSAYFTRFGCVSNAFMPVINEMEKRIKLSSFSTVKKFYMDVGTKETSSDIENECYMRMNKSVFKLLSKKIEPNNLRFEIIKDAIHHESAWEIRFPKIIKFLFSE